MRRHAILPLAAAAALVLGTPPQGAAAADPVHRSQLTQAAERQTGSGQAGPGEQTASASDATARAYGAGNEVHTADGIRFACTGVGKESRDNPKWKDLSTRIVYAAPDGAYLAGITTRISRADGQDAIFDQRCDAPWLLLGLEPGDYRVTAVSEGPDGKHEESATISVSEEGRTETVIRFPRDPS